MQFHIGTIPTGCDGEMRILLRIVQNADQETERYYGFYLSSAYWSISRIPTSYLNRTNTLLAYIHEHDPTLDDALWLFYQKTHTMIGECDLDRIHRLPHLFGDLVYKLFSNSDYLETIADFIDERYLSRKHEHGEREEFIIFGLIVGLLLPVMGHLSEKMLLRMKKPTVKQCVYDVGLSLLSLPRFCHISATVMQIVHCQMEKHRLKQTTLEHIFYCRYAYLDVMMYYYPIQSHLFRRVSVIQTIYHYIKLIVDDMKPGLDNKNK